MAEHKEKSSYWINIMATLASITLAVVSLLSVYITLSSWREERESSRPYFTFKESPYISISNEVNINFKFNNVGIHPALNLWDKTLVFDQNLKTKPIHDDQHTLVNDIPQGTVAELSIKLNLNAVSLEGTGSAHGYFIVIALQYNDPILHKDFQQLIFMKWDGVKDHKAYPIAHVEAEEKENILHYFQTEKIDLFSRIESKFPLERLD